MLCTVIERINIKKVDKCMDSDRHLDTRFIGLPHYVERLLCHTTHIRGPKYTKSMYLIDMALLTVRHPNRVKQYWSEVRKELAYDNRTEEAS
jgi:hypothetical protein